MEYRLRIWYTEALECRLSLASSYYLWVPMVDWCITVMIFSYRSKLGYQGNCIMGNDLPSPLRLYWMIEINWIHLCYDHFFPQKNEDILRKNKREQNRGNGARSLLPDQKLMDRFQISPQHTLLPFKVPPVEGFNKPILNLIWAAGTKTQSF